MIESERRTLPVNPEATHLIPQRNVALLVAPCGIQHTPSLGADHGSRITFEAAGSRHHAIGHHRGHRVDWLDRTVVRLFQRPGLNPPSSVRTSAANH